MLVVWLLGSLLAAYSALHAKESQGADAPTQRLFESAETLDVVLRLPWQTIVTDEFFYQGGYPSVLEVAEGQGGAVSIPVAVERRGMSRQVICRYPPIKLRFKKSEVEGTFFEGQKSLKLVIHCDKGKTYQQYLVLEALAYRMYNLVSDFSFRIRPLTVTFVDSETEKIEGPGFAFLVEDDSDVARRNGQKKLKIPAVRSEQLDPLEASTMALFQYMIANTAWSMERKADEEECCDNLKLIGQDPEKAPIYAVPNDFDSSGLVNARYATDAKGRMTADSTERVFQGFCVHNAALGDARKVFLKRETEILSLVENENRLADAGKTHTTIFLAQFFDVLKNPEQFSTQITSNCRD